MPVYLSLTVFLVLQSGKPRSKLPPPFRALREGAMRQRSGKGLRLPRQPGSNPASCYTELLDACGTAPKDVISDKVRGMQRRRGQGRSTSAWPGVGL